MIPRVQINHFTISILPTVTTRLHLFTCFFLNISFENDLSANTKWITCKSLGKIQAYKRSQLGTLESSPILGKDKTSGGNSKKYATFVDPREQGHVRPKAVLTTMSLLGVIYTASISGGYGLEESVKAGGPWLTIIFLCLIPFLWGIPVSLCVAELSCCVPSNAGPIMWVNVSFNSWFTFTTVLWTMMLNFVDNSLYPAVFADYCATFFPLNEFEKAMFKICFLSFCAVINIIGVHIVGFFSIAIMVVTMAPFALMFLLQLPDGFDWQRIMYVPKEIDWSLFLPVVSWNFSGFDSAGNVIEEVSNPNPTFINALMLMIFAAWVTYVPPVMVGASAHKLKKIPFSKWGDGYWVEVGKAVGGFPMAALVLIGGSVSTLGLMTTLLTTTSRSLAGMGGINAFPRSFSRWMSRYHPKYQTPVNAIIVNTIVTSILSVCLTFQVLVAVDQVLYSLRLIAILACFIKLRYSHPHLIRPYKVPGGNIGAFIMWLLPTVFSCFLVVMSMTGGKGLYYTAMTIIFGSMIFSFVVVKLWRPSGFEGKLVECAPDAELEVVSMGIAGEDPKWGKVHDSMSFRPEQSPAASPTSGGNQNEFSN